MDLLKRRVAANQRRVGKVRVEPCPRGRPRGRARRGARGPPARGDSLPKDIPIELLCLDLGLHAELALQHRHALLVLPKRGRPLPELRIEPHHRAVHGLLDAIECQQLARRPEGRRERAGLPLIGESSGQRLDRQLAQTLSLPDQPCLEWLLVDAEAFQEVAAVENGGPLLRLRRLVARGLAERGDIDLHRSGIERHRVSRSAQDSGGFAEILPEVVEGLPEARPRLLVAHGPPEQTRQLVAAMRPARRHGEIRE